MISIEFKCKLIVTVTLRCCRGRAGGARLSVIVIQQNHNHRDLRTDFPVSWLLPVLPSFSFLPREAMLSAVFAVVVCLCVCLSHSGIVSKRLNVGSRKQRRMIAP